MDHARAVVCGGERDLLGAERLHGVETLPPALEQDAHQVDDDIGVAHGRFDGTGVPHIGLGRRGSARPGRAAAGAGEVRPAHRDADAVVALGQRPDQVAAEEAEPPKIVISVSLLACKVMDLRSWTCAYGCAVLVLSWAGPAPAEYSKGIGPSRGAAASIDKAKAGTLCVLCLHLPCPGGGIGRRTSFRY